MVIQLDIWLGTNCYCCEAVVRSVWTKLFHFQSISALRLLGRRMTMHWCAFVCVCVWLPPSRMCAIVSNFINSRHLRLLRFRSLFCIFRCARVPHRQFVQFMLLIVDGWHKHARMYKYLVCAFALDTWNANIGTRRTKRVDKHCRYIGLSLRLVLAGSTPSHTS